MSPTLKLVRAAGDPAARRRFSAARLVPWLLVIVSLIGGVLRVWQIGQKGLWLDESFSIWLGWRPVFEMWGWLIKIDQHPPLYFTLLHFWMALGDSPAIVRLFSALTGTLTIPVIYFWGRRLGGPRVGLLAAFILALSPFHVRFAQETRMYALLALNAAVALLALTYILTDTCSQTLPIGRQLADTLLARRAWRPGRAPSGTDVPGAGGGRFLAAVQTDVAWLVYIVGQTAVMLTHNTALLFPVAVNLFVGGLILLRRPWRQVSPAGQPGDGAGAGETLRAPSVRNWLLAQLASFLLWSPWLVPFVIQARGVYQEFWIPMPTPATVAVTFGTFFSAMLPQRGNMMTVLMAGFVVVTLLGMVALRRRRAVLALLVVMLMTPFAGELLISLRRPIFYDRTLIWASLPLYLLLAFGVARLRCRPLVLGALALIVAANVLSLREYYLHYTKEQWREAAAYVGQHVQSGDVILFNDTWVQIPFDYYYRHVNRPVLEYGVPVNLFDRGVLEPKMTRADLPRLHSIIQGHPRVWLVYSHNWYTDPQNLIPPALGADLHQLNVRRFVGLEVRLYGAP